ncbi:MAG: M3 family oligoendopeptidase [Bacteroidetes bacterium]|nr:M3 family oligoendopeptidase [Bacteroidota bacterium]
MKKFSDIEYRRPDLEKVQSDFQGLLQQFDKAADAQEQETVINKINELKAEFQTAGSIATVRNSIDTSNAFYETEQEFFDNTEPIFRDLNIQFYKSLNNSPFKAQLEKKFGRQLFDIAATSVRSFGPAVIGDMQEENRLGTEYSKLVATAELEFRGEKYNLAGVEPFEQSTDRETRKEAATTKYKWWAENAGEFDTIYDKLVKTRTKIAHKLGYKNFVELGYDRMLRTDYKAEDVVKFRKQVLDHVVPLSNELRERQRRRLGLDKLKYYDIPLNFLSGNATPKGSPDWIVDNGKKMYSELSPETKEFFNFMMDYDLMDLNNKKNKQAGGYCTHFSQYKAPFIFSNFNGTSHDIDVLTHEAGHAFQCYQSRNNSIEEYLWPTYEACEIHSMSMEFFAWPWMELFFQQDTEKYKFSHLSSAMLFLPYGVAVDEFQHVVYENPDMTPKQRDEVWRDIDRKYRPYVDYDGNAYLENGGLWKRQGHIFRSPFYYIDYCLAQICALQFWNRAQKGDKTAWADYLTLCKAGGSKSFLDLVKLANLNNPFEPSTVQPVISEVKSWLDKVDDTKL